MVYRVINLKGIEIAYGPAGDDERCTWPGCDRPGLCRSGNFGNQIVCSEHFTRTNGETGEEASARIRRELLAEIDRLRFNPSVGARWQHHPDTPVAQKAALRANEVLVALDRICPE